MNEFRKALELGMDIDGKKTAHQIHLIAFALADVYNQGRIDGRNEMREREDQLAAEIVDLRIKLHNLGVDV